MTIEEYRTAIALIAEQAKREDDVLLVYFFSRDEDCYEGATMGMDAGDALIIIDHLIKEYGLSYEAIGAMGNAGDARWESTWRSICP